MKDWKIVGSIVRNFQQFSFDQSLTPGFDVGIQSGMEAWIVGTIIEFVGWCVASLSGSVTVSNSLGREKTCSRFQIRTIISVEFQLGNGF